jgi:hypothetical protein
MGVAAEPHEDRYERRVAAMTAILFAAAAHFVAIALALFAGYATYGREPRPPAKTPLLNKTPDDLSPGEVAVLDAAGRAGERAWTATVLDLMSRGVIVGGTVAEKAGDGTSETGFGIVRVNEGRNLLEHEEAVRSLLETVVRSGPVARVDLPGAIRTSPFGGSRHATSFRNGLQRRLTARAYAIVDARTFGWAVVAILTVAAAMMLLVLGTVAGTDGDRLVNVAVGVGAGSVAGAALALTLADRPGLWVNRSDAGSRALGRWQAYRAYLEATLGEWTGDPVGVSRGDRTTAYALALGLMPTAEAAWAKSLPKVLGEERMIV